MELHVHIYTGPWFVPLLVSHTKKAVRATLASWNSFCVQPVPFFIVMETKSGKLISCQDFKTESLKQILL